MYGEVATLSGLQRADFQKAGTNFSRLKLTENANAEQQQSCTIHGVEGVDVYRNGQTWCHCLLYCLLIPRQHCSPNKAISTPRP